MDYTTDNRWSPGASGATVPDNAPAAYSARWIDHDSVADIVPDRQGFAYSDTADRDALIALLESAKPHRQVAGIPFDLSTHLISQHPDWSLHVRRAGGYVYVDAWLNSDH